MSSLSSSTGLGPMGIGVLLRHMINIFGPRLLSQEFLVICKGALDTMGRVLNGEVWLAGHQKASQGRPSSVMTAYQPGIG